MNSTLLISERPARAREPEIGQPHGGCSYFSELIRTVFARKTEGASAAVLFVAPQPRCGVSYICSYVAAELALAGHKVLLADAEAVLALTHREAGRAASLCERIEPGSAWVLGMDHIQQTEPRTAEGSHSAISVLDTLSREFSHVVLDAPALSKSNASVLLCPAVLGTVFVAEANRTSRQQIIAARQTFSSLGARVFGSIYNSH